MLPLCLLVSPFCAQHIVVNVPWLWRYRHELRSLSRIRGLTSRWQMVYGAVWAVFAVLFSLLRLATLSSPRRANWVLDLDLGFALAIGCFIFLHPLITSRWGHRRRMRDIVEGTRGAEAASSAVEATSPAVEVHPHPHYWLIPCAWAVGQSLLALAAGHFGFANEEMLVADAAVLSLLGDQIRDRRWGVVWTILLLSLYGLALFSGLKDCTGTVCRL